MHGTDFGQAGYVSRQEEPPVAGAELTVGLLGPLEVVVGGRPASLTGRLRTLLAVLAMSAGQPVSVDRLATALWDEEMPGNARRGVQTYLTRLRSALGAAMIGTVATGYLLRVDPDRVDALRFGRLLDAAARAADPTVERTRLAEALSLWRGAPFDGIQSGWLERTAAPQLTERYLDAVERRVDLDAVLGHPGDPVAELRALIGEHPLRESLWVRLLVALNHAGRPAEALREYEVIRRRLVGELGTDPGPELRQVHADLLAGTTPEPAPELVHQPGDLPGRPPTRLGLAQDSRFVGRREQIALVEQAASTVRAGTAQFVIMGGEAGIGKTRLIEHCTARLAEAGTLVMRGACVALGAEGLPLAPITSALRDLVDQLGAARLAKLLPAVDSLLALLPEFQRPVIARAYRLARVCELFAALLQRLSAEQPVVFVVEDLHWADRSTQDLLGYLARTGRAGPVLALLTYRTDALRPGDPRLAFLAELERLPGVHRAVLPALTRAETEQLAAAVRGEPAPAGLVDRVFGRSGGNPFYIEELVRAGAELPDSLQSLLLHRVTSLPDPAHQVVRVAAVVGGSPVPHGLLAAIAGLADDVLFCALRQAVDAHVLSAASEGYRFRHVLLREAVLADLLPAERVRLHRSFAEALSARPELVPAERFGAEAAFHWHGAGDADRALPALLQAAEAAAAMYAHAEQCQLLCRALEVWPQVTEPARLAVPDQQAIWEKVVAAALRAGEPGQARELVGRALADLDTAVKPEQTAMVRALGSRAGQELGQAGVEAAVDEALAVIPAAPGIARARVLDVVSGVLRAAGQPVRAHELATEAVRLAGEHGDKELATNARITVGTALWQLGAYDEAIRMYETCEPAECDGDPMQLARIRNDRACVFIRLGRLTESVEVARTGLAAARRAGLSRTLGALLTLNLVDALVTLGRFGEAENAIAEALALDPPRRRAAVLHACHGEVACARGELELARQHASLAETLFGHATGTLPQRLAVVNLTAEIALIENRINDARAAIVEGLPLVDRCDTPGMDWLFLTTGARVAAVARRPARATGADGDGLAAELRAAAARLPTGTPLFAAHAAHFAAELTPPGADWPAVAAAWDAIAAEYAACQAKLSAAEQAATARKWPTAERWLRAAAAQAGRIGAGWVLAEAEQLADRTALAVRRD